MYKSWILNWPVTKCKTQSAGKTAVDTDGETGLIIQQWTSFLFFNMFETFFGKKNVGAYFHNGLNLC